MTAESQGGGRESEAKFVSKGTPETQEELR